MSLSRIAWIMTFVPIRPAAKAAATNRVKQVSPFSAFRKTSLDNLALGSAGISDAQAGASNVVPVSVRREHSGFKWIPVQVPSNAIPWEMVVAERLFVEMVFVRRQWNRVATVRRIVHAVICSNATLQTVKPAAKTKPNV